MSNTIGRVAGSSRSIAGSGPLSDSPILNVIRRAVVTEVINDVSYWTDGELFQIYNGITNKSILERDERLNLEENGIEILRSVIPRNSILCKIVTDGAGRGQGAPLYLAKPMFSSHLMMPVKAGEQVWIFQEKPQDDFATLFWMCRIPADGYVEDTNFSHIDREYVLFPDTTPEYNNGLGFEFKLGENPLEFETIINSSLSNKTHTFESVPRFSKRPGDLVLQGSNNSAVILGDDRGWTSAERPENSTVSNATNELTNFGAGTIDIVAGRGRFIPDVAGEDPVGTANKVVYNSNNQEENDKFSLNPTEGDPDFVTDSSRVYVSMNTNGDSNLGLTEQYPPIAGETIEPVDFSPYVIIKSDEVRIIARKDSENDINGSVKIIKEGISDDEAGDGRAVIMMQPDGTIVIDGPKIVIGSGIEKGNGEGTQVEIGDSATEPIVLGNQLKALLETMVDLLNNHVHPTPVGPSGIPVTPFDQAWDLFLSKVGKTK